MYDGECVELTESQCDAVYDGESVELTVIEEDWVGDLESVGDAVKHAETENEPDSVADPDPQLVVEGLIVGDGEVDGEPEAVLDALVDAHDEGVALGALEIDGLAVELNDALVQRDEDSVAVTDTLADTLKVTDGEDVIECVPDGDREPEGEVVNDGDAELLVKAVTVLLPSEVDETVGKNDALTDTLKVTDGDDVIECVPDGDREPEGEGVNDGDAELLVEAV